MTTSLPTSSQPEVARPTSDDPDQPNVSDSESDDDSSDAAQPIEIEGLEPLPEGLEPEQRRGVSKLGIGKKSWTAAEDDILAEIVSKNGAQRWSAVAAHLPGRAGKQCRERCARAKPRDGIEKT